jgi:hypothetical protein
MLIRTTPRQNQSELLTWRDRSRPRPEPLPSMALQLEASCWQCRRAFPPAPEASEYQKLPTAMAPSWSKPTSGATKVSSLPIKYHW